MALPIELLKNDALRVWRNVPDRLDAGNSTFDVDAQLLKEAELDRLVRDVEASAIEAKRAPGETRWRLLAVRSRVQKAIVPLLHSFGCVIDNEMEHSFSRVTDEFIRDAYEFDPSLTEEAVYQASRNVMIMNTFQMHLGKEVALTPSVFAYSLLYPYTDNYLDGANISREAKDKANVLLRNRLLGFRQCPRTRNEEIIDTLVAMIEGEFDRRIHPLVFESLYAIHGAQTRSVSQQTEGEQLSKDELLDISFEKGGTSVLADGYLVGGELSDDDVKFFFQFGVVLQLIDDLQDLEEDLATGQWTLAGESLEDGTLARLTDQLLGFLRMTLIREPRKDSRLYELIERSCRLLVLESIAVNAARYDNAYVEFVERRSPVRFGYLRELRKRVRHQFEELDHHRSLRNVVMFAA